MAKGSPSKADRPQAKPQPSRSQRHRDKKEAGGDGAETSSISSMTAPGPADTLSRRVAKRPSWYGSWPRKSAASTQVACETIHGDTFQSPASSSTSNRTRLDAVIKRVASIQSINASESHAETPYAETTQTARNTEVQQSGSPASSRAQSGSAQNTSAMKPGSQMAETSKTAPKASQSPTATQPASPDIRPKLVPLGSTTPAQTTAPAPPDTTTKQQHRDKDSISESFKPTTDVSPDDPIAQFPEPPSGWLSWLLRPAPTESLNTAAQDVAVEVAPQNYVVANNTPEDQQPKIQQPENASPPSLEVQKEVSNSYSSSSWLGYWYGGFKSAPSIDAQEEPSSAPEETQPEPRSQDIPMPDVSECKSTELEPSEALQDASKPLTSSTWAFWSRQPRETHTNKEIESPQKGELAVLGETTEESPTPALTIDTPKNPKPKTSRQALILEAAAEALPLPMLRNKSKKRSHDASESVSASLSSSPLKSTTTSEATRGLKSQSESHLRRHNTSGSNVDSTMGDIAAVPATAPVSTSDPPNLLLPAFSSTYTVKEQPSIMSQLTNLILRSNEPAPTDHVFRSTDPPARPIRNAISIGVHGLFPAAYLRPMVGQPTGTSLRFATLGAEAIARWTASHGFSDCAIEKVALEGEGKIGERVDNLWKLLLNWLDQLKEADLILVSCHSQGVPVGVMLLAKLLDLGVIAPNAHIGVCAMAGVCLGPFPDYKSSMGILMSSGAELWEFSNAQSDISQRLEEALHTVLKFGTRITFVGSIDDQVVPLESAVYSPAQHPHIYRAVFIDGRLHAPDFIAHLVGFALKLRNLGASDHGLIRELSVPLAGSLYSGEGHSRLYWDARVYDLALANALETTAVPPSTPCRIGPRGELATINPYTLPWVMRGLLEEQLVKTRLADEAQVLLRQFDAWKPTTKALKDVKYRLEAVRSRL
ncbi:uncharacterized protein BROUX77_006490 [Berkeleyomyces rouxiae]|uniref:uncharacterized protein n=1 Tax=Berkeleyomyces rouxiae TaxID=2035830 RepID=UPI003B7C954C